MLYLEAGSGTSAGYGNMSPLVNRVWEFYRLAKISRKLPPDCVDHKVSFRDHMHFSYSKVAAQQECVFISIECCKTKTKAVTMSNHNRETQTLSAVNQSELK